MEATLKIALIEPFLGGSHQKWAEGYKAHSQHRIEIFGLPARFWKWRMHGGAISLAKKFLASDFEADLILCSDMLDVGAFLSLSRTKSAHIPTALYFHENQLTYPWSPTDQDPKLKRDNHYSFINYQSALVANAVYFNSNYHRNSFLQALPSFLKMFPDHREEQEITSLQAKSHCLHLGMDLQAFDPFRPPEPLQNSPPVILWNHRWEYDKNPEDFFTLLFALADEGIDFKLVVLGEGFGKQPAIFTQAQEKLRDRILHWGFAQTFEEYASWLWKADILPVTSRQDFFGGSVVEAMYCGCYPLLPNRLAYPEHLPDKWKKQFLYDGQNDLVKRLRSLLHSPFTLPPLAQHTGRYNWKQMAPAYDVEFRNLAKK